MAERIHLDSIPRLDGTDVLTLVIGSTDFYVEQCRESPFPFFNGRMKVIRPVSLKNYYIRGVSLSILVDRKLRAMNLRGASADAAA